MIKTIWIIVLRDVVIVPVRDIAVVRHALAVVIGSKCRYLTTFSVTSIIIVLIDLQHLIVLIFKQRWRIQPWEIVERILLVSSIMVVVLDINLVTITFNEWAVIFKKKWSNFISCIDVIPVEIKSSERWLYWWNLSLFWWLFLAPFMLFYLTYPSFAS